MIKADKGKVTARGSFLDLMVEYTCITKALFKKLSDTLEPDAAWELIEENIKTAKMTPEELEMHLLRELQKTMEKRMEELSHE